MIEWLESLPTWALLAVLAAAWLLIGTALLGIMLGATWNLMTESPTWRDILTVVVLWPFVVVLWFFFVVGDWL